MLYIVISDDNPNHNYFLEKWVKNVMEKHDLNASLVYVTESVEEVWGYAHKYADRVNVYILDIDFNGERNGLELAQDIREVDCHSYIIFITAYEEYSISSFKVKTFDYLIKPVTSARIEKCILNVYRDYIKSASVGLKVPVKCGNSVYMLDVSEIIYFEKCGSFLKIHLTNGVIRSYEPLKRFAAEFADYGFIQCHRSFVVNPRHVEKISLSDQSLLLSNGEKCYISRKHKKEVMRYFANS